MSNKVRSGPHPKADSWRSKPNLPIFYRVLSGLKIFPPNSDEVYKPAPGEKMPVSRDLYQVFSPLPLAFVPFGLLYWYYNYVSAEMPSPFTVWMGLILHTLVFGGITIWYFNALVRKHGYLDSGVGRDTVSYDLVPKVGFEIFGAAILRPAVVVLGCYDPKQPPRLSWWLPVQLFMLTLTEDFTYYWFHRFCHEVDSAWSIHRRHHTTKHPTTILLGYADDLQEFVDLIGSPIISWFMCPFGFEVTATWIYILVFVQLAGHTGLRMHFGAIMTGPFLRPFGLELVVEDHDLHHRHGWKDSYNYGKQSRFWDALYGTTGDRVEGFEENLDYNLTH